VTGTTDAMMTDATVIVINETTVGGIVMIGETVTLHEEMIEIEVQKRKTAYFQSRMLLL